MKKIIIGKNLEEVSANCNFCKEHKVKECIESEEFVADCVVKLKDNKELKWLSNGLFSLNKLYWVIEAEYETETVKTQAYICKDCIKQLAKLI